MSVSQLLRKQKPNWADRTKIYDVLQCAFSPPDQLSVFPQQSSIESQGTISYKAHTYTDRKLPAGFAWSYFHLQNHTRVKDILWEGDVGVHQTPHIHLLHCAAHGWCSHGTCMVCRLRGVSLSNYMPAFQWAIMKDHKQQASVCSGFSLSLCLRFNPNSAVQSLTRCYAMSSWGTKCVVRQCKRVNVVASWPWLCLFITCHSDSLWTSPRLQHVVHCWWQLQLWNYEEQLTIGSAGQTHTSNHRISRCWPPGSRVTHMAKQSKSVIQ